MTQEFNIKELPNITFRVGKISPISFLALRTQVNFSDLKATEKVYEFILEHIEVNINNNWIKVKQGETYMPMGISDNLLALNEIIMYFLTKVFTPVFTKSGE